MGDHRATIKIEFTMYGKTRNTEMSINWFPAGDHQIDQRVINWFYTASSEFRGHWELEQFELRRKREEEQERELYERLKAKYEPNSR